MDFEPKAGQIIYMFNKDLEFQPCQTGNFNEVYVSQAGTAYVYKVKDEKEKLFALKIFRERFRLDESNATNCLIKLDRLSEFKGTTAATRSVMLPTESAAKQYTNLSYSMLIPWITGQTACDIMQLAAQQNLQDTIDKCKSLQLCETFLNIMTALEEKNIAHTDVSADNIIIDIEKNIIELIDLEDIFVPGFSEPKYPILGKENYRHKTITEREQTLWCQEADRYSAAVFAAELLLLSSPNLVSNLSEVGFFTGNCTSKRGQQRFNEAKTYLGTIAPAFSNLFEKTWLSDSLTTCPTIKELLAAIEIAVKENVPTISTNIPVTNTPTVPTNAPVISTNTPITSTTAPNAPIAITNVPTISTNVSKEKEKRTITLTYNLNRFEVKKTSSLYEEELFALQSNRKEDKNVVKEHQNNITKKREQAVNPPLSADEIIINQRQQKLTADRNQREKIVQQLKVLSIIIVLIILISIIARLTYLYK